MDDRDRRSGCSRRRVVGAWAGALAALGLVGVAAAQRSVSSGGGIAGGGSVATAEGEAHFSLFGSRFMLEGQDDPVVFGSLRWVDPHWQGLGLTLESTEISAYGPIPNPENARELRGLATANGVGSHPFVLRMEVAGPPGSGEDMVSLAIIDASGTPVALPAAGTPAIDTQGVDLTYAVSGPLTSGDLELLTFEFPPAGS